MRTVDNSQNRQLDNFIWLKIGLPSTFHPSECMGLFHVCIIKIHTMSHDNDDALFGSKQCPFPQV